MVDMAERFLYRNFLEEEVEKRFTEEYDEEWGIYLSDNLTGDWYNINPFCIVDTCNELWEQVVKLSEENEKLREELSECEKFRHSVFKRIEKTIENRKNCAINKDAKYPCKAYDECLKRKGTNKPLPCMVNWAMGRPFENMIRKEALDE